MKEDLDYKEATKEAEVQKPIKLANLSKWSKFYELFSTFLSQIKGAANTPLSYLIWEHEEVTQEMLDADYASTVDCLFATTVLEAAHFYLDNRTLYNELKPLVVDGPGWAFIRKFDKAKDGRKAVLALKAQAEGLSSTLTHKTKAYASIASAVYRGPGRGSTFTDYVSVHQDAHNKLFDCKVVVEDSKKVDDFLNGIQDPGLVVGKTVVLSDPLVKLGDFEACQQYLSTLVMNMSNRAKLSGERNASSATWGGGGDNSALIDRVKGGQYTDGQFCSFSKEEKDCVARYWEESKKKKKKGKRRARNTKRRLAKAQSERNEAEDAADGDGEESTSGNGAQFGANGNRNKKP
jgi:hypothetical protein